MKVFYFDVNGRLFGPYDSATARGVAEGIRRAGYRSSTIIIDATAAVPVAARLPLIEGNRTATLGGSDE